MGVADATARVHSPKFPFEGIRSGCVARGSSPVGSTANLARAGGRISEVMREQEEKRAEGRAEFRKEQVTGDGERADGGRFPEYSEARARRGSGWILFSPPNSVSLPASGI